MITLLARYGEISLKRGNLRLFEKKLIQNIKQQLPSSEHIRVFASNKRIFIEFSEQFDRHLAEQIARVPGIVSLRICHSANNDWDSLTQACVALLSQSPLRFKATSFAVRATRANKNFPMNSMDIERKLGAVVLEHFPEWQVDLTTPTLTLRIDVQNTQTYLSIEDLSGPGGLPVGSSGHLALLLSGGIDSPVAGYFMQKRGAWLSGIYFHSFPYTGDKALTKVKDLSAVLSFYQKSFKLYVVHFTDIQEAIRDNCHSTYGVILNRRMMMRLASRIAIEHHCLGLVTGESLGQVASQTLENMASVNAASELPVYRPLIGLDKVDITRVAEQLQTLDISNRPYEDCCTLFVDKHPVIKSNMDAILKQEQRLDIEALIEQSLQKTEVIVVR